MDPNSALANLRRAVWEMHRLNGSADGHGKLTPGNQTLYEAAANDLAETAKALDEWLSRGGFLPSAWER